MKKAPLLSSHLIVRKGEALPSVENNVMPLKTVSVSKQKTVALTVKLDTDRYARLKLYGAQHRLSNQEILVNALDQFLKQRK